MAFFTFFNFNQTITTTLTAVANGDVTREWINAYGNTSMYVGFEVETDIYTSRIGTVQLCIGNQCLVIRLQDAWPCAPFLDHFLCDANKVFIGNDIRRKINLLKRQFPFTAAMYIVDFGDDVPFLRAEKERLMFSEFALRVVEFDWDRRLPNQLSHHQVHYASLDAFLNLHLAKWFWNLN